MPRTSSVVTATTQRLLRRNRRIELAHTGPASAGLARTTGHDVVDAATQQLTPMRASVASQGR